MLKSGGDFNTWHVSALAAQVKAYLSLPYRLCCLTDMLPSGLDIEPIPLLNGWPGWYSKLELFRPRLFNGPVFYADLDTIICGQIDDLVDGHRFTVLENFWREDRIGSGLMAWGEGVDLSQIYHRFCEDTKAAMLKYAALGFGDQAFVKAHTPVSPERWQHKHPGRIVSYKRTIMLHHGGMVPPEASIICWHGVPRPWDTQLGKKMYKNLAGRPCAE